MEKLIKWFVRRIILISQEGGKIQFALLRGTSSGNVLGEFYRQLPLGLRDTRFGGNLKNLYIRRG